MTKGRKITIISMAVLLILCTAVALLGIALTSSNNTTYVNDEIKLSTVADTTEHTIQGYQYGFGEYKKIDGLTFAINESSGFYVLSEFSKEKLNTTYGESRWRFIDSSGNPVSYGLMGSGQSAYLRFNSLPDKFIYLDVNATKAVEFYANDWGIYKDLNITGTIYISQVDFNNNYRCHTAKEDLDSRYGVDAWRFINSEGNPIGYTFEGGSSGGKSYPFFNEYPAGFCFDLDCEVEEPSYIETSKLYVYGAKSCFINVNYKIQKRGNYVILPSDFIMTTLDGDGILHKKDIEFNYLDYNIVKYDDFLKYTLAFDPTDVTYALIFNVNSDLTITLDFQLLSTTEFEKAGIAQLSENTYKCKLVLNGEFGFLGINNGSLDILTDSREWSKDYVFNTKPLFIMQLEQEKYNINYELDGGTWYITQPPKEVTNWFTHTLPNPSKYGYVFDGFYDNPEFTGNVYTEVGGIMDKENPTILNSDITLYAKWSQVTNEVRYDLDGGVCENIDDYTSYISGTDMQLPTPTKRGYNFLGWYTSDDIKVDSLKADVYYGNPIMLTAKWEEILYNIKYEQNGGTFYITIPPKTFGVDGIKKLPSSSRQGYIFAGWYLDEVLKNRLENDCIPADFVIDHDITVYAKWTAVVNEVRYELDGGTCDNIDDYTSYVSGTDMELPSPTKEGYNFLGWYTSDDIKVESLKADVYYGNPIMLAAKWEIKKFVVTYHLWGVHPAYIKEYEYGEEFNDLSIMAVAVKNGTSLKQYKFLGWSTTAINVDNFFAFDENTKIDEFNKEVITETVDLYAIYYGYNSQVKISINKEVTLYSSNDFTDFTLYNPSTYDYKLVTLAEDNDIDSVLNNSSEDNKNVFDKAVDSVKNFFSNSKDTVSNWVNDNKAMFWTVIVIIVIVIAVIIVLNLVL